MISAVKTFKWDENPMAMMFGSLFWSLSGINGKIASQRLPGKLNRTTVNKKKKIKHTKCGLQNTVWNRPVRTTLIGPKGRIESFHLRLLQIRRLLRRLESFVLFRFKFKSVGFDPTDCFAFSAALSWLHRIKLLEYREGALGSEDSQHSEKFSATIVWHTIVDSDQSDL